MASPSTTRLVIIALAACFLPMTIGSAHARQQRTPAGGPGESSATKTSSARRSWDEKLSWYAFTAEVSGGKPSVLDSLTQLLDSGVSPNTRDRYGNTALHAAATGGAAGVVRYLLGRGADVNARDKLGRTPLMITATLGGVAPFVNTDLPVWGMLWTEPMCGSEGSPAALSFSRQALDWYKSAGRHRETLLLLLSAGADVNALDGEGRGPLDYAARGGLTDFDDLIRRGGKVTDQPTCELGTERSPALRGFRLGMTSGEALGRFRAFSLPVKNSCGRLSLSFSPWWGGVVSFARVPAEFEGVIGLRLSFLDDRLAYVRVTYERGSGGGTPAEFRAATLSRLSLPGVWRPLAEFNAEEAHVIGCDGFKVMAGYRDGPYVELYDTAAARTLLDRRAEEEDRRRREEEVERERRKKSYKP